MKWNGLPIVIFGTEGTSRDIVFYIEEINKKNKVSQFHFLGFVDRDKENIGKVVTKNYKVVAIDTEFPEYVKNHKILGVVFPMGVPKVKKKLFEQMKGLEQIVFPNIIHPSVIMDLETIELGMGNVIAPNVSLTHDIIIGNFNLLNNHVAIGHDCKMGDYNVVNPGATVSGNVAISDFCLIGTGANILQGKKVGAGAIVGAGAVVIEDIREETVVVGVPAKEK